MRHSSPLNEFELLRHSLLQFLGTAEFLIEDGTCAHVCFLLNSVAKYTFADVLLAYKQDLMFFVSAEDELITFDEDFYAWDLAWTSHSKESRRDSEVRIVT